MSNVGMIVDIKDSRSVHALPVQLVGQLQIEGELMHTPPFSQGGVQIAVW